MPLTRGRTIGYNVSRMTFEFTMMDDKAKVVDCEISSVAIDQLACTKGMLPAEREAQFCNCGTRSSALHLIFSTKCRHQAARSAFSTIMLGDASLDSAAKPRRGARCEFAGVEAGEVSADARAPQRRARSGVKSKGRWQYNQRPAGLKIVTDKTDGLCPGPRPYPQSGGLYSAAALRWPKRTASLPARSAQSWGHGRRHPPEEDHLLQRMRAAGVRGVLFDRL